MALEFAPLPFHEAIAWARARQVVLPDVYYGELQGLARSMAFSVAGMAKLDQLQQVLDSLNGALERGDSFASWKKTATDPAGLVKLDLPAHRVENIFRTNIQGHYGRGRCEQQKRNVESHPWYLYDAINDSRTRPTHAAMDGMVARHDDTIWARWTPPVGYQCRCRRIALTEKQAARFIEADTKRLRNSDAARARVEAQPDQGWDYNPCAEPDEGLRRAWAAKVGRVHPLLAEAATQAATMPPVGLPAWTILEGDQATLDEIKRLGGERLDEFMAMVTPDDGAGMTTLSGEPISIKAFMGQPAGDVLRGYFNGDAIMPWLRAQMLDRLRAVRSVGGAAFKLENKSGKGVALSKRVSDKFPTSWVEKVNAAGAPYRVTVNEYGRGWHSAGSRKIQTSSRSTAEHEWTHAVQAADPVLDALFQDEHRRRTVGEALEWLGNGYGASEKARRDHYVTAYQGKEYDARGALEVITMAMQAVLGDDRAANEWFQGMVKRDPEMLKLALGALFHYRPKL